ncbi:hypothetical protein K1719_003201 [Acacia pycnantha]|nr:hypothetical protein K1719_003201 [Acacia pycnantha]
MRKYGSSPDTLTLTLITLAWLSHNRPSNIFSLTLLPLHQLRLLRLPSSRRSSIGLRALLPAPIPLLLRSLVHSSPSYFSIARCRASPFFWSPPSINFTEAKLRQLLIELGSNDKILGIQVGMSLRKIYRVL